MTTNVVVIAAIFLIVAIVTFAFISVIWLVKSYDKKETELRESFLIVEPERDFKPPVIAVDNLSSSPEWHHATQEEKVAEAIRLLDGIGRGCLGVATHYAYMPRSVRDLLIYLAKEVNQVKDILS